MESKTSSRRRAVRSTLAIITIILTVLGFSVRHRFQTKKHVDVVYAAGAPDSENLIATFQGDSLDDIVRLVSPIHILATSSSPELILRDAVYLGGSGQDADLLTLWTVAPSTDQHNLLSFGDGATDRTQLGSDLQAGRLHGTTFVLGTLHLSWQQWKLKMSVVEAVKSFGPEAQA